jgi:hypothetical protein
MNARAIRIIKPCEFGEPGDVLCPEPWDIACLLVETRGVAVYEETSVSPHPQVADRSTRRRRSSATSDK